MTSLLKESTQGVSSLLREITASSAVSILIKPEQETDPLPVMPKHVSAGEPEQEFKRGLGKGRQTVADPGTPPHLEVPRGMKSDLHLHFQFMRVFIFFFALTLKGT